MKQYVIFFVLALVALLIWVPKLFMQNTNPTLQSEEWQRSTVKVGEISVDVRLAISPEQHRQGLSGTESLGETEGMLFLFDKKSDSPPVFWMKDMLIPLDFIWIKDNKVFHIHQDIPFPTPGTSDTELKLYAPNGPVDYVLEVNAGFIKKHNVVIGTEVDLSELEQ